MYMSIKILKKIIVTGKINIKEGVEADQNLDIY